MDWVSLNAFVLDKDNFLLSTVVEASMLPVFSRCFIYRLKYLTHCFRPFTIGAISHHRLTYTLG